MQKSGLTKEQKEEVILSIESMLLEEFESDEIKERVRDLIADYIELNEIEADPESLADEVEISVKVKLI